MQHPWGGELAGEFGWVVQLAADRQEADVAGVVAVAGGVAVAGPGWRGEERRPYVCGVAGRWPRGGREALLMTCTSM